MPRAQPVRGGGLLRTRAGSHRESRTLERDGLDPSRDGSISANAILTAAQRSRRTERGFAPRSRRSERATYKVPDTRRPRTRNPGRDHGGCLHDHEHPIEGAWIAFSQDGLTWSSSSWLQRGKTGYCPTDQLSCTASPYITIVADDGTDNGVVGDSFWVYWSFGPDWEDPQYPNPSYSLKWVARQRVTLYP